MSEKGYLCEVLQDFQKGNNRIESHKVLVLRQIKARGLKIRKRVSRRRERVLTGDAEASIPKPVSYEKQYKV